MLLKLGIEKEVYAKTMQAYSRDAEKRSVLNCISREINETPEISSEDKEKLEALPKTRLLEIS